MNRIRTALIIGALLVTAGTTARAALPESFVEAMEEELERNRAELRLDGYPAPYFLAYQLKDMVTVSRTARRGALVDRDDDHDRLIRIEVRVGSYDVDNTEDDEGQSYDELISYSPSLHAPLDDDPKALKHALWLATDRRYKEALAAYHRVKGGKVYELADPSKRPASFSKVEATRDIDGGAIVDFDADRWEAEIRRASERLARDARLFDSTVMVEVRRTNQILVNSEGTRIVTGRAIYGLHAAAHARADDGMLLEHSFDAYADSQDALVSGAALDAQIDALVGELVALRAAPVLEPYTGPAILEPKAAGVIFHEAVGHRLEGHRQSDEEDGRTFTGQIGKGVLPKFLTVYDDPTLVEHGEFRLNGFYEYDDEGTPAQRADLVDRGVLRGFLLGRKPVEGQPQPNGHGRAQANQDPVARMGNLIVESDRTVPRKELKRLLLEQARKQNKPFGLIIGDIAGGSTNTSSYGYQAFKGLARMVYKVDAETGEETLVRGVEIVGTPLSSINKILQASRETGVFNGYCGAESGYVPVSTVAPAMLFEEIELQRSSTTQQRPQLLPPPSVRGK